MHRFRILVPVSFADQSDIVLKQAKTLAKQLNAMITCLHVIEKSGFTGGRHINREIEQKFRRESELKLASKVNRNLSGDEYISYELIVSSGGVHRKILEKASELNMDLIIMGRCDSKGGTKSRLGSNATKVIERSEIPVLTIRNSHAPTCQHILVPLDLSTPVSLQLAKAIEWAEMLNALVTVCAVIPPDGPGPQAAYKRRLIEIKKLFDQYDISCRVRLLIKEKQVVDEILSCSRKYHPNLMMLMTQEEAKVTALSLGSIADALLSKSEIPMLTVTPVIKKEPYPFRSLFGSINNPILNYDHKDHLIKTN